MKNTILAIMAVLPITMAAAVSAQDGIPRTPAGKPDFSGNYNISSLTPFERPESYGDRLYLSDEEVEAMREREFTTRADGERPADLDGGLPEKGGNVGGFNDFWMDRGNDGFAIDGKYRTSILTYPENGRMPERTEAGKEKQANAPRWVWPQRDGAWWLETGDTPYDGPENQVLLVRCIYNATSSIAIRPQWWANMKTIVQTDDYMMLYIESMHWARIIRIDAEHKSSELASLDGDSIGWWEEDTLVVETTNFLDEQFQPSAGRRVVERFSPLDEGGLLYSFTVEDPDYEGPYSGELVWPKTDQQFYEFACHEGNYSMAMILRGARLREREWREANEQ